MPRRPCWHRFLQSTVNSNRRRGLPSLVVGRRTIVAACPVREHLGTTAEIAVHPVRFSRPQACSPRDPSRPIPQTTHRERAPTPISRPPSCYVLTIIFLVRNICYTRTGTTQFRICNAVSRDRPPVRCLAGAAGIQDRSWRTNKPYAPRLIEVGVPRHDNCRIRNRP